MRLLRYFVEGVLRPTVIAIAITPVISPGCHEAQDAGEPTEKSATMQEAVSVRVKPVVSRKIGRTISALGRCEALPQKQAVLTPVVEGRVGAILANLGDAVKANQPIIQLDTALAKADLAEKQAARDSLV